MRILFVYLHDSVPDFSIGIGSMSAMLKPHGHSTSLSHISGDRNVSQLLEDIGNIEPEVVAFCYETPERFTQMINLNVRLGPLNSPWSYIFHPYPKTSVADLWVKEGWIRREVGFKERLDTALDLPQFSRRHIVRYFNSFHTLVKSQSGFFQRRNHCTIVG